MQQIWELDTIYPGGSQSPQAAEAHKELKQQLAELEGSMPNSEQSVETVWLAWLEAFQRVATRVEQLQSFYSCCMAQDVNDTIAKQRYSQLQNEAAHFEQIDTSLASTLAAMDANTWQHLVATAFADVAFPVLEKRQQQALKMDAAKEQLVTALATDGYHGWSQLYDVVVGRIHVDVEIDGERQRLSVGQAENLFASGDARVRQSVFNGWEQAWAQDADLGAEALNHIGGYRLALYKQRGWDRHLDEPLRLNRMSQLTLDAMWEGVRTSRQRLIPYMERKAELLHVERLSWADQDAPLNAEEAKISYDEACGFVAGQFQVFNPDMAAFAEQALAARWVEAEDRSGKMPGGFCIGFPEQGQSRIFMTYGGTYSSLSTLAHELGHAYHSHLLRNLPPLRQAYAMNVAETASTFAELLVSDAALKTAASPGQRLNLLDQRLQQAVALLMNIDARFTFEDRFYAARAQGPLTVDELNELMETAQKESYLNQLSQYHPLFWVSKLHFYLTDVPFYNFPYTFGYLFSAGLYSQFQHGDEDFAGTYEALLRDSGSMTVEDLAEKHLAVRLDRPEFWQQACQTVLQDVDLFIAASKTM